MFSHDPLLAYEKSITHITVSKPQEFYNTHPPRFRRWIFRGIRFLALYAVLTGSIFTTLMAATNYSAYSERIAYWLDPSRFDGVASEMRNMFLSANEVHAMEAVYTEELLVRSVIEERVALTNPEIVYSRSYSEEALLANVPTTPAGTVTFQVAPFENRIIIPRLGKNIPLLDVRHDTSASFTQMHEVFMEELRGGVVRYPGTALPGEQGNAFIFGHSSNYPWVKSKYNDVFALLDTLEENDEIIVYYNQKKFIYRVTDRAVVKPGDVAVLEARDPTKKEISLMTCWPIGTTLERLIIFGELEEAS